MTSESLAEQIRTECPGAFQGLFVLPGGNLLRIAGEQDLGDLPAVELGGTGIDGRGQEAVLEGIGQGARLVAQGARQQPDHGIGDDGGRQLAAAEHVVPHRDLPRDQMLPDPVVHSFVMAAQDHQVLHARKFVGYLLGERLPVGCGEDDLVVRPLGLELLHQAVDRLDHHHHAGVTAETVVVHLAPPPEAVFPDVVHMNLHETLVLGPFDDGISQGALEQPGDDGQDIDSHIRCKFSDYLGKKTIFAGYN